MTDDAEQVTYKKAIFSFIDILGFREFVKDNRKNPNIILKIIEDFNKKSEYYFSYNWKEHFQLGNDEKKFSDRGGVYSFSDCFVKVQECSLETDLIFCKEIYCLRNIQSHLAMEGIFIRGGITYGDIFYKENTVFGPAMIRAYELESRYADFPRIIVDPICPIKFSKLFEYFSFHDDLKYGSDGFTYLGYFNFFGKITPQYKNMGDKSKISKQIYAIKSHIENGVRKYKNNERVMRKYYWLTYEYNETFSEEGSYIDIEKLLAE